MANRCPKCKQKLQGTDFLCPRCGHILGQAVYTFPKQKTAYKIPWRQILSTLGVLLLIAAMAAGAWFISRLPQNTETTAPTTVPTEPPTTATPLTSYHVQLTADTKYWIEGTTVHFCKDGQELYSGQVEADGKITFIAPKGEGYSIRLSNLYPGLAYHYGDTEIPFPDGYNSLVFHMENKPVRYTVRVVNTAGEPVPQVMVGVTSNKINQHSLTGADGIAIFDFEYHPGAICCISTVPNGYFLDIASEEFAYGSFSMELVVHTYAEMGVDPAEVKTVKFVDENGEPLRHLDVNILGRISDDPEQSYAFPRFTNQEGCVSFRMAEGYEYRVNVPEYTDYQDMYFPLDRDSKEQTITLYLNSPLPQYTYTVTFRDQHGEPIEGVIIVIEDSFPPRSYTSDENGNVSFPSKYILSEHVSFWVGYLPAGYVHPDHGEMLEYYFPGDSRNMEVVINKGTREYRVSVYTSAPGASVVVEGVELDLIIDGKRYACEINADGFCWLELPYLNIVGQFQVELTYLPEGYEGYVVLDYWMELGDRIYIYIDTAP